MTHASDIADYRELDDAGIDSICRSNKIPVRPSFLQDWQADLVKDEPDMQRVVAIASQDASLCGTVLGIVNSPFYGQRRRIESMQQALLMLGMKAIASLVLSLVARRSVNCEGPSMTRFWDVSAKRSMVMHALARKLRFAHADMAQTFGLFCDIGIPLMATKYPGYIDTLANANTSIDESFSAVERAAHGTDHSLVGAVMAKSWGLPLALVHAVYMHHAYGVFEHAGIPDVVKDLVAMNVLSERIIQVWFGQNQSRECERGGEASLKQLLMSAHEFHELHDDMHSVFETNEY